MMTYIIMRQDITWMGYELKKLLHRRDRVHKNWKKTGREEHTAF